MSGIVGAIAIAQWENAKDYVKKDNELAKLYTEALQDCVWLKVEVKGGASCHVGYRSCFYRSIPFGPQLPTNMALKFEEKDKIFNPKKVYGNTPNPTKL